MDVLLSDVYLGDEKQGFLSLRGSYLIWALNGTISSGPANTIT